MAVVDIDSMRAQYLVMALLITRRALCVALVGLLALAGCGGGGSYTESHCVAFEEAVKAVDPVAFFDELAALATPSKGETVDRAVQRAAQDLFNAHVKFDSPPDVNTELETELRGECAKARGSPAP